MNNIIDILYNNNNMILLLLNCSA